MGITTRFVANAVDATYSQLDPAKVNAQIAPRERVTNPTRVIDNIADAYVLTRGSDRLDCLYKHLLAQAKANSMLSSTSEADMFFREWMTSSIAIAYLKAKTDLDRKGGAATIRTWLRKNATDIVAFNEAKVKRGAIDNHRYWGGLAALTTGMAIEDWSFVQFGRRMRALGFSQVETDGVMLPELKRGAKSYHYHVFAAAPLAAMLMIDRKQAPTDEMAAMRRLALLLVNDAGAASNGKIARLTNVDQEPTEGPPLYYLFQSFVTRGSPQATKLAALIARVSPNYLFLGGDVRYIVR